MQNDVFSRHFALLIDELAELTGRSDLVAAIDENEIVVLDFDVDTIPLQIVYSHATRPEIIFIVCRLGELPDARRTEVLERLLQVSFTLIGMPIQIGLDPTDGQVVLSMQSEVARTSAESLEQFFVVAAAHAAEWRKTYFLGETAGWPAGFEQLRA